MSFRPTFTVSFVFLAVATSAYFGWPHSSASSVSAQESPAGVSGASDSSIQHKLELAQIRLAIRLQEVEIAKVQRRLLVTGSDGANDALNAKEKELMIADTQYSRLKEFHELGNIALEKLQEAEAKRLAALAEVASCRSNIAAHREKLLVHDETIKLLELRAQLAQTKLDQLKRQQK